MMKHVKFSNQDSSFRISGPWLDVIIDGVFIDCKGDDGWKTLAEKVNGMWHSNFVPNEWESIEILDEPVYFIESHD